MTTNAAREPRGLSHARTSFVGRSDAVNKVAGLAAVTDPALVPAVVATVLGLHQLDQAGEGRAAATALTAHALSVAERAAEQLARRDTELSAARWLDAEDATVHQGLAWALDHDPPSALKLALALAPWWLLRGRWVQGYALLQRAAGHADPGDDAWCAAQSRLSAAPGRHPRAGRPPVRCDRAARRGGHVVVGPDGPVPAAGVVEPPHDQRDRERPLAEARRALDAQQLTAAENRGGVMTLAAAVEFAVIMAGEEAPETQATAERSGLAKLSARERELVTLVAQGRTDAQIAEQLFISVRTVRTHLDRIRDKSGCRRRADLTRLALQAGII